MYFSGEHNDCFLASDTDFGTYTNKEEELSYMAQDNLFCVQGGETCALTDNDR